MMDWMLTLGAGSNGATPLQVNEITRLLLALAALLGLARLLGEVSRGLGQPAVLGEILAGVLLGPTVLGAMSPGGYEWLFPTDGGSPLRIAEEGFILMSATLLLLVVGLEVDLSTVWRQGRAMLLVAALGTAIPFIAGFSLASVLGDALGTGERASASPTAFAVFVGLALSITALPVIAKILMDLNLAKSDLGMLVISSAMLNDLVGWIGFAVVLALLPAGVEAASAEGYGVLTTIGATLLFLVLMLTVGRWLLHRLMPYIQANWSWPGGVMAFVFVVALLCAALTEHLGIHSIFGAFVAGVAIGDSYHLRERTRDTISQFVTNIFAPVFFASIGLRINFVDAFDPMIVGIVLGVALTGKVLGCFAGAKLARLTTRESWAVGFGMAAQGAVGIILGNLARQAGLITDELLVAIVIMALGTSLLSGPVMQKVLRTGGKRRLHEMLSDRHILLDPKARTLTDLLREMSEWASELVPLDAEPIYNAVWARESAMHTALPHGLAVPHARLPGLSKPLLVMARCREGIDFDSPDGELARHVCLILTPDDQPAAQIELLGMFAEAFSESETRQRCLAAGTATEYRAVLHLATAKPGEDLAQHDQAVL
ncbi:MAG: cation:proton antiporter [Planctomycetota bacterium]